MATFREFVAFCIISSAPLIESPDFDTAPPDIGNPVRALPSPEKAAAVIVPVAAVIFPATFRLPIIVSPALLTFSVSSSTMALCTSVDATLPTGENSTFTAFVSIENGVPVICSRFGNTLPSTAISR